ncbi:hypothetical protein NLG97_g3877 [Lecanicillium saksenae]|uniref:Uncharacterized protein n=1 Tax=Lecanicillium saksenae TaxID=468837 RepID=A0ACC1QXG1_9HYPO|nr:hypothetical protein NLG97_g3877 [Lecanicillium saksenae]
MNMAGTWQDIGHPERQSLFLHAVNVCLFAIIYGLFHVYFLFQCALNRAYYRMLSIVHGYGMPLPRGQVSADIKGLSKMPKHISAILSLGKIGSQAAGVRRLATETAELAAWCAEADISMLSVYEKTGILKETANMDLVYQSIRNRLECHFGGRDGKVLLTTGPRPYSWSISVTRSVEAGPESALQFQLISASDGREAILGVANGIAPRCRRGSLSVDEVSIAMLHAELTEQVFPEPDLLVIFGPSHRLAGYPPWQIRLTEIFCLKNKVGFGYLVFRKALQKYARAQMRRGQ